MQEKINALRADILAAMEQTESGRALYELKVKFQQELKTIMAGMKELPKEEKPVFGKIVNEFKQAMEAAFEARAVVVKEKEMQAKYASERIDITMPGKKYTAGALHPITLVKNELIDVFAGMGFKVFEGPEIETDYYNFEALNIPKNHPARSEQDTFYINDSVVLRTQTSGVQIRVMEKQKPPIKMISPGKVYRADSVDATHSPIFHQMEGLVVAKGVTFADLKGTLELFVKKMFGDKVQTKFRPHHFPFTEPSAEMDATCFVCGGKGCNVCKNSGWIEMLGCGMVHPNVLRNCGIDPEEYSGFAFGFGIDRMVMLSYGLDDIRLLYESDMRFLNQF